MALTQVSRGLLSTSIVDNGNATAITIDSSENVGIGTSSPSVAMHAVGKVRAQKSGQTSAYIQISADELTSNYASDIFLNDTGLTFKHNSDSRGFVFDQNGTERMRIDSSGNLLVGTTDTAVSGSTGSVTGAIVNNTGLFEAAKTGTVMELNRLTADGTILNFRKDGTTVGRIGSRGGDVYLETSDTGIRMFDQSDAIIPVGSAGVSRDAAIDLGISNVRFKDLHLSGDVNLANNSQITFASTSCNIEGNSSGADFIKFTTGNNEAARLDSAGNLLVGTTDTTAFDGTSGINIGGDRTALAFSSTGHNQKLIYSKTTGLQFYNSTTNSDQMMLTNAGNLLVGTNSGTGKLEVYEAADLTEANPHFRITGSGYSGYHWLDATAYYIGQNSSARALRLYSGAETAGVNLANGGTSWGTFSDERLKYDVEPIENALESLSDLRTVKYRLRDVDEPDSQKKLGVVAQDLVGVLDEVIDPLQITGDDTEYMAVRYTELVPVLIKAIQEQQATITALEARITQLEN